MKLSSPSDWFLISSSELSSSRGRARPRERAFFLRALAAVDDPAIFFWRLRGAK